MLADRVILKENRYLAVSDGKGDMPVGNELGLGLFHLDTRFLSGYELRIQGKEPILLSSSVDRAYVATFQLVNQAFRSGEASIPRQTLSLRRTRFVHDGLHERVGLQNCNRFPVDVELEFSFAADFEDIFGIRSYYVAHDYRGRTGRPEVTATGFRFGYSGKDGVRRDTEVVFNSSDARARLEPDGIAVFELHLEPQQTFVVEVGVVPLLDGAEPEVDFEFDSALAGAEEAFKSWNLACSQLRTDNEVLNRGLLWRSREDLRVLCDDLPTGLYPTAGIPWYAVPFGRDGLITAIQCLNLNPELTRGTLRYLARHQGQRVDQAREEEPGKIFHEIRFGQLANLGLVPHTPYYGTVDATPLFLVALVAHLDWTGDVDLLTELAPNVLAALEWCDRHGDLDGDGFVEYQSHNPVGVRNMGWKDSYDSLTEPDGEFAELPAALVEVQGYVYQAKRGLARIFAALGQGALAARLELEAETLRQRFEASYWLPHREYYAQALDAQKRPVDAVTSNPGHCLWSGVVDPARARAVADRLTGPALFSGWGIRTLASDAVSYNPMSYHNGSVWPHDNSIIAAGLSRYGFKAEAERVCRAVLEAGMRFGDARMPELFCGFTRDGRFGSPPGEYLVSCSPQAWGAGAVFHFLETLCGLRPDALHRRLVIDPLETPLYSYLRVEGMRFADGRLDFSIDRRRGATRVLVDRAPAGVTLELPS